MQKKLSPMMAQWYHCKKQAKNALLLFRLGDFYEAFYDDASLLADELDLTLTQRQGVPMSGVPAHTVDSYIEKLVAKGFIVALAEQTEDPKQATGLVKREVVRIVSPGTLTAPSFLSEKINNFFGCLVHVNATFALALLDLSTGEFITLETEGKKQLQDQLFAKRPSELLLSEKTALFFKETLDESQREFSLKLTIKEALFFTHKRCYDNLTSHFQPAVLQRLDLQKSPAVITAAGALLGYLRDDMTLSLDEITDMQCDNLTSYMAIDQMTQRNLELTDPLRPQNSHTTLLHLLDQTHTPMGGRLFRTWLTRPLLSVARIQERQYATGELLAAPSLFEGVKKNLRGIKDLERLVMRIARPYGSPRDLIHLATSLTALPALATLLAPCSSTLIADLCSRLPDLSCLTEKITSTLIATPPVKVGDGPLIRDGVDSTLDELRRLKADSQSWIASYQQQLKESTGIKTLKIIYSKAFGYCIEVSRAQASRLSGPFERRQTLVNSERFISEELKSYEEKILSSEEQIAQIELTLYRTLRASIASEIHRVKQAARIVATVDCLTSLACVAKKQGYTRPRVDDSALLELKGGRHPVIEAYLPDHHFIPNNAMLHPPQSTLLLITGPNMGGKSTYIRQVALIAIMAQIGSFVPAEAAHIGIVDKVFSRIGASDDLARGQSTFMVEMTETAHILNHATPHSLVLLDEVGRGTSTSDGIALAFAVADHLIQLEGKGVKTLFATHYLELTSLKDQFPQVKNLNVAISESNDLITFLHKIVPGSADKSYGIHVAKLAQFPAAVIQKAKTKLKELEAPTQKERPSFSNQLNFLQAPAPKAAPDSPQHLVLNELKSFDLNGTTPLEALQKLASWQKRLQTEKD